MKRIIMFVTEKQDEKLENLAKETGLAKSEIVRHALDSYFLKEERSKSKQEKQDVEGKK